MYRKSKKGLESSSSSSSRKSFYQTYRKAWERDPKLKPWLMEIKGKRPHKAFCRVCKRDMSSYCNGTSGRIDLMIFIGITIATAAQQWWIDRTLHYKAC
uniref:Uncharacterized protein n=1 Tax=Amphimedon queenslandica TaxID=400682 RepID=A0A1X7VYX0_AMPQE